MSSERKFYVYVHRYASGPKQGQIFYVGKGKGKRVLSEKGRNFLWLRIKNKYGFKSEKIKENLGERCALTIEKIIIFKIGFKNLVNLTTGGEGLSGFKHGENKKSSMRAENNPTFDKKLYLFSHKKHGDVFCTRYDLCQKFSLNTSQLGTVIRGNRTHHAGWHIKGKDPNFQKGEDHPSFIPTEHTFWHPIHGYRKTTRYHLIKEFGLNPANVMMMMNGKYRTSKGWRLAADEPERVDRMRIAG